MGLQSPTVKVLQASCFGKPAWRYTESSSQLDSHVTLQHAQGKLLASINNRVQLYGWTQREAGARELAAECGHSGHVCALFVETRGDFILVGRTPCSFRHCCCHKYMCSTYKVTHPPEPL